MERTLKTEVGWSPAQGSYEEAVLSWQEQIDQSFRRRYLESQRTGSESQARSAATIITTSAIAD